MKWFFITVVVPWAVLIPLGMAAWNRQLLPPAMKIVVLYLLFGGVINLAAGWLADRRINNLPLLHLYTASEFIILSHYYKKIAKGKIIARLVNAWLFLFPVACIANAFFFQPIHTYNTYTRSLGAILIILYTLFGFNKLLDDPASGRLIRKPAFWINTGLLLYFSGSLLLFLFAAFMAANRMMDIWAWRVHGVLVLCMYLLFTVGFYQCRK